MNIDRPAGGGGRRWGRLPRFSHLDHDLPGWASAREVLVPGAFTLTEIDAALARGAPAVKLFPASLGGPGLSRTLLARCPDLPVIRTGGVDDNNAGACLEAGAWRWVWAAG